MVARAVVTLTVVLVAGLAAAPSADAARKSDPLASARQFYNSAQYDQAIEAARDAASRPPTAAAAHLIIGRSRLERYRNSADVNDLDHARDNFRAVDAAALSAAERAELQIGLGELFYLEERFGAAAELLAPIVEQAVQTGEPRARVLEWWATALDRQAQALPASDRAPIYARLMSRMEEERRRDPGSPAALYWIAAAARASGDLERAWSAAMAGWVRATLGQDRGAALRGDLDKLVRDGIIPDRAAKVPSRERRETAAALSGEWESFKKVW